MNDYKKILEGVVNIISSTTEKSEIVSNICSYIDENCPELKESKDERIRKWLIKYFNDVEIFNSDLKIEDIIAWLEKQSEQQPLYIRFGDIPSNEKSKIYCGEEEIGEENGVSVYPAFEVNGDVVLGLALPITKTTLYTQQHLLEYENRQCYLVKGDYVGKDTDGQPLINNVQIIKKIDNYKVKEEKVDNAEPKIDPTFLFKVKYNDKEYKVRGIFSDAVLELEDKSGHFICANLDDCEIIKDGYGIKESGSPYPTKPATFSEQEPVDKIEPKFKLYDWVVTDKGDVVQIGAVNNGYYTLYNGMDFSMSFANTYWHKWTTEDAKDGDVIAMATLDGGTWIGMFKEKRYNELFSSYCFVSSVGEFKLYGHEHLFGEAVRPATKEQKDILFEKMKEAGYKWDSVYKKVIKIKTN